MRAELAIRFDYGSIIPWVTRHGDHSLQAVAGPDMVVLHSDTPMRPEQLKHQADFTVGAGETVSFVLAMRIASQPARHQRESIPTRHSRSPLHGMPRPRRRRANIPRP